MVGLYVLVAWWLFDFLRYTRLKKIDSEQSTSLVSDSAQSWIILLSLILDWSCRQFYLFRGQYSEPIWCTRFFTMRCSVRFVLLYSPAADSRPAFGDGTWSDQYSRVITRTRAMLAGGVMLQSPPQRSGTRWRALLLYNRHLNFEEYSNSFELNFQVFFPNQPCWPFKDLGQDRMKLIDLYVEAEWLPSWNAVSNVPDSLQTLDGALFRAGIDVRFNSVPGKHFPVI